MNYSSAVIFLLVVTVVTIDGLNTTVPHHDCGSPLAYVTRLEIIPTCEKNVYVLTRGNNVTLLADFVSKINSKELAIHVFQQDWYLNVETVLWHNKNVCNRWNVTCPAVANETQYAVFRIRLPENLPMLKLRLKLILLGDGDKQLLCESVPLDIR